MQYGNKGEQSLRKIYCSLSEQLTYIGYGGQLARTEAKCVLSFLSGLDKKKYIYIDIEHRNGREYKHNSI